MYSQFMMHGQKNISYHKYPRHVTFLNLWINFEIISCLYAGSAEFRISTGVLTSS